MRVPLIAAGLLVALIPAGASAYPELISRLPDGSARGFSYQPVISADDRWLVYTAINTYVRPGPTDDRFGVFAYDLEQRTTRRLSEFPGSTRGMNGAMAPALSASGRHVLFRISQAVADELAGAPVPNHNGGDLLVALDRDVDGDGVFDEAGATRFTVLPDSSDGGTAYGITAPRPAAISPDGRYLAYRIAVGGSSDWSTARQRVMLHDRDVDDDGQFDEPGATATRIAFESPVLDRFLSEPCISGDGVALLVGASDLSLPPDAATAIHRLTIATGAIDSVALTGAAARWPRPIATARDGDRILFNAGESYFRTDPAFVLDFGSGAVRKVDLAAPYSLSTGRAISADGRLVATSTTGDPGDSGGLVHTAGNWTGYVFDLETDEVRALQLFDVRGQVDDGGDIALASDGRFAIASVIWSAAVPGDTNAWNDLYLFDRREADLSIAGGTPPDGSVEGGIMSYPITVTNRSAVVAREVWIRGFGDWSSTLPSGGGFLGQGCETDGTGSFSGYRATSRCRVGDLQPGESRTGTIRFAYTGGGAFGLEATVFAESAQADLTRSDNVVTVSGDWTADVQVTVSPPTKGKKGKVTKAKHNKDRTYAITIRNPAPSIATAPLRVVLFLSGPAATYYRGATIAGMTCSQPYGTAYVCEGGGLAVGGMLTGTFTIKVIDKRMSQTIGVRVETTTPDRNLVNNEVRVTEYFR